MNKKRVIARLDIKNEYVKAALRKQNCLKYGNQIA